MGVSSVLPVCGQWRRDGGVGNVRDRQTVAETETGTEGGRRKGAERAREREMQTDTGGATLHGGIVRDGV